MITNLVNIKTQLSQSSSQSVMSSIKNYFSSSGKSSESLKTAIQIAGTKSSITSTEQREVVNALGDAALPKNPKGKR